MAEFDRSLNMGVPGQSVSLGAVGMPPMVDLSAAAGGPPMTQPGTMGSSMGSVGANLFPTIANLPIDQAPPMAQGMGAARAPAEAPLPIASEAAAPSMLQSSAAGIGAERDAILDYLGTNRTVTTSRANPLAPIVQREQQIFEGQEGNVDIGPFSPQPFAPPPIEPGEDEFAYMQRVQGLQDENMAAQQAAYSEQQAAANVAGQDLSQTDVRRIGEEGFLGGAEASLQAAEDVGGAVLDQTTAAAEARAQAAEREAIATGEIQAADQERRDRARDELTALGEAHDVQIQANKALQSLPPLDPGRFWKSQSGASKFFAVLGSIAGGAIGSTAVPDHFERMANKDLEVQKANAAQVVEKAGAADAAVGQRVGIYRQLLDAAGDEGVADLMYLQLQREDAALLLEAEIAKTTVPVIKAQLQESLLGVRMRIDQAKNDIDLRVATTPEHFVTRRQTISARQQKILRDRAETLDKQGFELTKLGVKGEEAVKERQGRIDVAGVSKTKESDRQAQQLAAQHMKDTAKIRAATTGLTSFREKSRSGDISGRGFDAYFLTQEGRGVREDLKENIRRQMRFESQGAITEEEIEDRSDSIMSGWGDDELLQNVDRLITANEREIGAAERGIGEGARKLIYSDPNLAPLPPMRALSQGSSGVEADAAALGGTVFTGQ